MPPQNRAHADHATECERHRSRHSRDRRFGGRQPLAGAHGHRGRSRIRLAERSAETRIGRRDRLNTSCTRSSRSVSGTPRRRSVAHTWSKCSSKITARSVGNRLVALESPQKVHALVSRMVRARGSGAGSPAVLTTRSKLASQSLDRGVWRIALAASVATIAACQLDLAGKALVGGPDASGPSGSTDPDERSPDARGTVLTGTPNSANDGDVPTFVVGRSPADAADEATDATRNDSTYDAGGPDSFAASVDADASTPCARLLQCCPRLLVAPLALACIAGAMQDGGDDACESALSSLADAGVCP